MLHAEPQVGVVHAEARHRLLVGEDGEAIVAQLQAEDLGPQRLDEALGDLDDGLARGEAHLEVDLGELGLPVGAEVLVAEALDDLEVAVEAGDHQELLEDLRALGEGVPLAGVDPAGDEVVAGALGRRAVEHRGLDLDEAEAVEELARSQGDLVADEQVALQRRAPQIEVAVRQPHLLAGLERLVADGERQGLRAREDADAGGKHLDLAGLHVRVGQPLAAEADGALDLQDVLQPGLLGDGHDVGIGVLVDCDLHGAVAVAQDEEDDLPLVAVEVDPALQGDRLAGVRGPQLPARVAAAGDRSGRHLRVLAWVLSRVPAARNPPAPSRRPQRSPSTYRCHT